MTIFLSFNFLCNCYSLMWSRYVPIFSAYHLFICIWSKYYFLEIISWAWFLIEVLLGLYLLKQMVEDMGKLFMSIFQLKQVLCAHQNLRQTEADCIHAGVGWEGAGVGWEGSPAHWTYTAPLKISELTPKKQTDLVWTAIPAKDSSSLSLLVNTALGLLLFKSHYCFQCLSFLQILYNRKIYSGYNYFLRVDNHMIMLQ